MTSMVFMTLVGVALTVGALIGLVKLRGPVQLMFCVGMLFLAATWFIPVIVSILLQSGMTAVPWPANAILNVILHSAGAGLLLIAVLSRGRGDHTP